MTMKGDITELKTWKSARETERLHREGVYQAAGSVVKHKGLWLSLGTLILTIWGAVSGAIDALLKKLWGG